MSAVGDLQRVRHGIHRQAGSETTFEPVHADEVAHTADGERPNRVFASGRLVGQRDPAGQQQVRFDLEHLGASEY